MLCAHHLKKAERGLQSVPAGRIDTRRRFLQQERLCEPIFYQKRTYDGFAKKSSLHSIIIMMCSYYMYFQQHRRLLVKE
jgi:hypothetical protein